MQVGRQEQEQGRQHCQTQDKEQAAAQAGKHGGIIAGNRQQKGKNSKK